MAHSSPPDARVFITENPSVLAAAADMLARNPNCTNPIRLVCTMSKPSQAEISAIAGLAATRWNIAVRADFDPAGIRTVTAVLNAVPTAKPWRMTATDYATSRPTAPIREPIPPTPARPSKHSWRLSLTTTTRSAEPIGLSAISPSS